MSLEDQHKLLTLLLEYEELFDGTLGNFVTSPVSLDVKLGKKSAYARPYTVPKVHKDVFKKELDKLVELRVLALDNELPWVRPAFIILKKNGTVHFLMDL